MADLRLVSNVCRFLTLCALFLSAVVGSASAATDITSIEVEGNSRIEDSTVLLQVGSEIGKPVSSSQVEEDIKNIYRTGFFAGVTAKVRGGVLIFQVTERPSIKSVTIEGNDDVDDKKVEEQLNLTARRFLDTRKIALGIEELKKYYQQEGFYGTSVEYEAKDVGDNQVDLVFTIDEGDKKVIRKITFDGNTAYSDKKLTKLLATSKYKWWVSWITGSGIVKEENLERDVGLLTQHYLTSGYVDAKVSKPEIVETEDGLELLFRISEGEVFRFGTITVVGDLLDGGETETLDGITAKTDELFDVSKLRDDSFKISDKYTDIGYAFVNVDPNTNIDRETKLVNVEFSVNKGELITVNRISVLGNTKTRDNVVRRSLRVTEGELFSSSKIRRSQELLQRLGYFDEVTITPSPAQKANEVDLNVALREGNTGTFSVGAGLSSGEGFIVSTRISEANLFGSGNSLSLDVNTGSRRENYVLSFNNPRVDDSRWSLSVDALSVEREFDDFDRNQVGGSIRVGYPLWFLGPEYLDDIRFSLGYELLRIEIEDVDKDAPQLIIDEIGTSVSSSVTPRLVRNTIDNPLDPSTGSRQLFRVELAGLGGDERFWLAQANNTMYVPIWRSPVGNFVFSHRVRFGWGDTFNDEKFPLFRRFFPGGINSVRGFDSRELGPKDAEGNEFGGNKQLISNFEVIFPLVESFGLKGVVFYDIGNAFDDGQSIEFADLRQAVGWGIRWRSPIAPIRVEIGYPLDREAGDKAVVTNFSFGAPL